MPDDLELALREPGLRGTAWLAQSALHAPLPPVQAEADSRRRVEMLMQEASLSPKVLREAVRDQPHRPWWRKFLPKG